MVLWEERESRTASDALTAEMRISFFPMGFLGKNWLRGHKIVTVLRAQFSEWKSNVPILAYNSSQFSDLRNGNGGFPSFENPPFLRSKWGFLCMLGGQLSAWILASRNDALGQSNRSKTYQDFRTNWFFLSRHIFSAISFGVDFSYNHALQKFGFVAFFEANSIASWFCG
jgi:hypothetical protein